MDTSTHLDSNALLQFCLNSSVAVFNLFHDWAFISNFALSPINDSLPKALREKRTFFKQKITIDAQTLGCLRVSENFELFLVTEIERKKYM